MGGGCPMLDTGPFPAVRRAMPRFAILDHDHPAPHFDLLLQAGAVAWTWRLASVPEAGGPSVPGERIADHRLLYLDQQGEVSGGRGTVVRVDGGEYTWVHLATGRLVVALEGRTLRGELALEEVPGGWTAKMRG